MTSKTLIAGEISAADLEAEVRRREDIVLIDTRRREDFAAWHIPGVANLRNIPDTELASDPDGWLVGLAPTARVRVICYAGVGSKLAAGAIASRFAEVRSVRGGMIGWSRLLRSGTVRVSDRFTVVQFRREARGCLSYLIASEGEAIVVDPAPVVDPYLEVARSLGVRITHVFDTHIHADHISGARRLAGDTGAVLTMPEPALRRGLSYREPVLTVRDGDHIPLGDAHLTVAALPGHTSDMTGLLLGDAALVGGDSVFVDSLARPDLEFGREGAEAGARELYATVHERLGALPDHTVLLPCHYPGGRRTGPLTATLGDIRSRLAELALDSDEFVTTIIDQLPDTPSNHLDIIAINLGGPHDETEAARLEVGANRCAAAQTWAGTPPDHSDHSRTTE